MSWDIFVQHIPHSVRTLDDMPSDYDPLLIGKRDQLISSIRDVVPDADFSDPAWGIIEGPGYSAEVNMGNDEDVKGFAFHVRGGDDSALLVADVLEHLGLRGFDPSSDSGIFGVSDDPRVGLRKWREYKTYVLDNPSS